MCFIADVTVRKQLEEQRLYTHQLEVELAKERELIELKERFMSMISHEYRTPLSIILSSVEMITRYFDRLPRAQVVNRLERIGRQVHYMVELLEQILIISRANSGKLKFEPQSLSLVPFCESLINDVRVSDENQHQFVFDHQNVPEVVQADGRLLEHILTNLLSNASKYSTIGTTVQLNLTVEEDELVFTVCDEGIGIPDEDTPRLFEPFHRGQNVESVQGTGLGLTIVKQNTELHNGRVTFSTNNHGSSGTTFCVYLSLLTEPVHQAGGSLAGNDSTEA